MRKHNLTLVFAAFLIVIAAIYLGSPQPKANDKISEEHRMPQRVDNEEEYDEDQMKLKQADWSQEAAAHHQDMLNKYQKVLRTKKGTSVKSAGAGSIESFGSLNGVWYNRGPNNMPGAFKFAEMLDGTDTIYAVTHNHYSGEFNSKSYIYKGTVYNPSSGTMG